MLDEVLEGVLLFICILSPEAPPPGILEAVPTVVMLSLMVTDWAVEPEILRS